MLGAGKGSLRPSALDGACARAFGQLAGDGRWLGSGLRSASGARGICSIHTKRRLKAEPRLSLQRIGT